MRALRRVEVGPDLVVVTDSDEISHCGGGRKMQKKPPVTTICAEC